MKTQSRWELGIPIIAIIEIVKGFAGILIFLILKICNHHFIFIITIVMICICKITLGIGLLMKKEWARIGMIGLMFFLVPYITLLLYLYHWGVFLSSLIIIGCLIACFYIYYFYRQDIRSYFQNERNKIQSLG